ncbi:CDC27 family protein [Macrococcoides canis]|uniref:CDC27 family protein n=1 Tax=Macrococcoides canis TaxID=1855823 RepID=UPI0010FBD278|nr:CDC27 family protein [Macrococcus canis]QCT75665.1 hypothetical protein EST43_10630 [Macrococcus canis]
MKVIYNEDAKSLKELVDSNTFEYPSELFSNIVQWIISVIHYYNDELDIAKRMLYQINPRLKIENPIDIHVLNSIALILIKESKIKDAYKILNKCINSKFFEKLDLNNSHIKIKYNYARCCYKLQREDEAYSLLLELENILLEKHSNFMLGKILYFKYLCCIRMNKIDDAIQNLKRSFSAFYIDEHSNNKYLITVINKLKDHKIDVY